LARDASPKRVDMSPHRALGAIGVVIADGGKNGLMLVLESTVVIWRRERDEPESQRPLIELPHHLDQLEIVARLGYQQMKLTIEQHHGMNVAIAQRLSGAPDDVGQLPDANIIRSYRCEPGALRFVDRPHIDHLHDVLQIHRFNNHPFARDDLDHLFQHQAINRFVHRCSAKPQERGYGRFVDAFTGSELACYDSMLNGLVSGVAQRLAWQTEPPADRLGLSAAANSVFRRQGFHAVSEHSIILIFHVAATCQQWRFSLHCRKINDSNISITHAENRYNCFRPAPSFGQEAHAPGAKSSLRACILEVETRHRWIMDDSRNWITVADRNSVEIGGVVQVKAGDFDVALYNIDGQFYATDNICTHAQALLSDGWLEGDIIECPLHGGRFEVKTGKGLGAPITCDVRTFPVRIEGDAIQIDVA